MTKICILNERFSDGGISNVTRCIGQALSTRNSVVYYSFLKKIDLNDNKKNYFSTQSLFNGEYFIEKVYRKCAYYYFQYLNDRKIDIKILYKKKIDEFCSFIESQNIQIIILSAGFLTSLIPEIKKRVPSVKIVAWQHNNAEVYFTNYYKNIENSFKLGLASADLVVCLTDYDRLLFSKYNKNTVRIYNPLIQISNEKQTVSNLSNKKISFVSRYTITQKGIDLLIEVAKQIPKDWIVSFAGGGSPHETARIKKIISKSKVEDRIILEGKLFGSDLKKHYQESSIFLSTSRWEGFGLVLLEAMNAGLPVISFNTSGPKEILLNGEFGILIDNYNTNEMALKVKELCNSKVLREYWQAQSLQRIDDFSIEKISKDWEEKISYL